MARRFHTVEGRIFCRGCGYRASNIGIFQAPLWHCYRCEPMEESDGVPEEVEREETKEIDWGFRFSWHDRGGTD